MLVQYIYVHDAWLVVDLSLRTLDAQPGASSGPSTTGSAGNPSLPEPLASIAVQSTSIFMIVFVGTTLLGHRDIARVQKSGYDHDIDYSPRWVSLHYEAAFAGGRALRLEMIAATALAF